MHPLLSNSFFSFPFQFFLNSENFLGYHMIIFFTGTRSIVHVLFSLKQNYQQLNSLGTRNHQVRKYNLSGKAIKHFYSVVCIRSFYSGAVFD